MSDGRQTFGKERATAYSLTGVTNVIRRERGSEAGTLGTVRAVIVEDEPLALDNMRRALENQPGIEVVGVATDGAEALERVAELRPDLLFLDVRLPDMDGFQVLQELDQQALPEIVFVTAHDEHALQAFEVNAVDYLLKPLDDRRLEECLRRAVRRLERRNSGEIRRTIESLLETVFRDRTSYLRDRASRSGPDRILVRDSGRILPLDPREVDYMEAAGNYVRIHTRDGRQLLVRSSLSDMEARLDPARFTRIHRSTIVNLGRIRELEPWVGGDYTATLTSGEKLRVSRNYRDALLDVLG